MNEVIITKEWLEEKQACKSGVDWVLANAPDMEGLALVKRLIDKDLDWANWLIVRIMTYQQYVSYAVFAAEQVIDLFEKKYPKDKRPRKAIEAAKRCIDNPSKENKDAASAAADVAASYAASSAASAAADVAASYASYAAYAASAAADVAASYAASSAAYAAAASSAAYAAAAASAAADVAASYASYAAYAASAAAAKKTMKLKILTFGIKLMEGKR